jgi:hypothetical protein
MSTWTLSRLRPSVSSFSWTFLRICLDSATEQTELTKTENTEWDEPAGALSVIPVDENAIAEDDRIPRVTSATWKYETGAVGSLTHALVLQGTKYSCELEVYADGYQLKLIDPYNAPELRVRTPDGDDEQVYTVRFDRFFRFLISPLQILTYASYLFFSQFGSDDPYASELSKSGLLSWPNLDRLARLINRLSPTDAFIDETESALGTGSAVADDDSYDILSSYEDACKTYAL